MKVAQGRPRGRVGMRARLTQKPYKTNGKTAFPARLQTRVPWGRVQASRIHAGESMENHCKTLVKQWFPWVAAGIFGAR